MLRSPQMPLVAEMTLERSDAMYQHTGFLTDAKDVSLSDVLIVDDQRASRYELRHALDNHPRLTVIGEAADGATAIAMVRELEPDIVVVGLRLTGMSGIAVARQILRILPTTRVVILSVTSTDQLIMDAMQAGVFGFLPCTIAPDALARAIVGVADGEVALSRKEAARLLARLRRPDGSERRESVKLTKRENEVARLLAHGATDRQIAQQLTIEESTAKKHVQHILRKMRVRNRAEAVAKYLAEAAEHNGHAGRLARQR